MMINFIKKLNAEETEFIYNNVCAHVFIWSSHSTAACISQCVFELFHYAKENITCLKLCFDHPIKLHGLNCSVENLSLIHI